MIGCKILYVSDIITLYVFSIPYEHTYLSASHIINSQSHQLHDESTDIIL